LHTQCGGEDQIGSGALMGLLRMGQVLGTLGLSHPRSSKNVARGLFVKAGYFWAVHRFQKPPENSGS
jgi:hypothetical protein